MKPLNTCLDCGWWDGPDKYHCGKGFCRLSQPREYGWPVTKPSDWCSHWSSEAYVRMLFYQASFHPASYHPRTSRGSQEEDDTQSAAVEKFLQGIGARAEDDREMSAVDR